MSQRTFVRLLLASGALLLASTVVAVPPDELQPPVFVDYPDGVYKYISHCDDSAIHQFKAILPDQPHAQGRVRYRLVEGPGQIDEKTGLWVWHPEEGPEIHRACPLVVAASVNGGRPGTIVETQCSGRLYYSDDWLPRLVWGMPRIGVHQGALIFRIDNPGLNVLPISLTDIDSCDHPALRILQVTPTLDGRIFFTADTALIVELTSGDLGGKYGVSYEITSGPFADTSELYFDTRPPVVPVFVDCPQDTLFVPICGRLDVPIRAEDPDFPEQPEGIWYRLESSPDEYHGHVVTYNGHYFYHPLPEHAGEIFPVEISAHYADTGTTGDQNCRFWVKVSENTPPVVVAPQCSTVSVAPPNAPLDFSTVVGAIDPDACQGSPLLFLHEITPAPANGCSFDSLSGEFRMTILSEEMGTTFNITVGATDAVDTVFCTFAYLHLKESPSRVVIEHAQEVGPGSHCLIDLTVQENSLSLWGFDLLVAWDASVLILQGATPGDLHTVCGWEYFTYRHGASGYGDSTFPSGLLRIVGIAETNNGDAHPSCLNTTAPFTFATLDFFVTNDRTFECTWQPIRFWWMECSDNIISYHPTGDFNPYTQAVGLSRRVFEHDSTIDSHSYIEITDTSTLLPGYSGAPNVCLQTPAPDRPNPYRVIDFYNGGIDIACSDSVDRCQAGDLNLNGIPNEVADVAIYLDVFLHGPRMLTDSICQTKASDANMDGYDWSLEDLVYLTFVAVRHPLSPISDDTSTARFVVGESTIRVEPELPLGAVYIIFDSSVVPTMLAERVSMSYFYDQSAGLTRCLISALTPSASIQAGDLLTLDHPASIRELSAVTDSGAPVNEIIMIPTGADDSEPSPLPISFALYQNHPNPFNLETVIPFDLPASGAVSIEIFNALGQSVYRRTALYPAGSHQFSWDGHSDNGAVASTGVYYYRVSSNDHTQTRKMVLLK